MTASTQRPATPRRHAKTPALRCAHCGIELTTGEGIEVPYIGTLGPTCIQKYAPLLAILRAVDGLEAHEEDQGSIRLAHHVLLDLRRTGVAVKCVDVRPGVKAVQIVGISGRPAAVVKSWEQVRAEFEHRLKLAAAERQAQGWVAA